MDTVKDFTVEYVSLCLFVLLHLSDYVQLFLSLSLVWHELAFIVLMLWTLVSKDNKLIRIA